MEKFAGPFREPRRWLANYMQKSKMRNDFLTRALEEDWTPLSPGRQAFALGAIFGRLRQIDQNLENATEFQELVQRELP